MANYRYYSDIDACAIELHRIEPMANDKFASLFPGIKGFRYDGFTKYIGVPINAADYRVLPVTRKIEYKSDPSLHKCNARCANGKCNGICECKCGGMNHGRGTFSKSQVSGLR